MEPNTNEATAPKRLRSGGRKPLIIIGIVLAVLAVLAGAAYLVCCYLGTYSDTFAPRYTINGVNVGGLTVEQASEKIWEEYQQRTVSVYLSTEEDPIDFAFGLNTASDLKEQGLEPVMEIPVSELGVTLSEDYEGGVHGSFIVSHGQGFFINGWNYLRCLLLGGSYLYSYLNYPPTYTQVTYNSVSGELEEQEAPYPFYLKGTKRDVFQLLCDVTPGGQIMQCVVWDAPNLPLLPVYSAALTVVTTGAGLWGFRRKDLN